jgi:hypothetical protein
MFWAQLQVLRLYNLTAYNVPPCISELSANNVTTSLISVCSFQWKLPIGSVARRDCGEQLGSNLIIELRLQTTGFRMWNNVPIGDEDMRTSWSVLLETRWLHTCCASNYTDNSNYGVVIAVSVSHLFSFPILFLFSSTVCYSSSAKICSKCRRPLFMGWKGETRRFLLRTYI